MTIGDRIRKTREEKGISQDELAQIIGYKSKTSIHKVEQGITDLPLSKVNEFATALNVTPAYLMGWEDEIEENEADHYYLNPETRKLAQEIYENPDLRILFDASRNLSPEDINMVTNMIKRFKKDDDF